MNTLKPSMNSLGAAAGGGLDDPADGGDPCPPNCPDNLVWFDNSWF